MSTDLSHVYLSPVKQAWSLADASKRRFRKELIYAGEFDTGKQRFVVDEALLSHWVDTFDEMQRNGVKVPVPVEHTQDPEKRRATLVALSVEKNARGVPALFGEIEFIDDAAARLASSTDVSLYIPPKFKDGGGRTYYRPIQHVALTDYPVIPGLGEFAAIAASYVGEEPMSLQSLAEKLAIQVADKEDSAVEAEIFMKVQGLMSQVETLTKELADATKEGSTSGGDSDEGSGSPTDKTPAAVAAGFVTLARDNRAMKLDRAVEKGLLTPAARKIIEERYCSDAALSLSMRGDDGFDAQMKMLEVNGPTLEFKEKTGGQGVALSHPNEKVESDALVKDAERRAAAFKK